MSTALAGTLLVVCAVLALWAGVAAALDRQPGDKHLLGLVLAEVLVIAQVVLAGVRLSRGERPDDTGSFVGYLVLTVFLLPGASIWSMEERTRWGTAVLAVGPLVLAVVVVRLLDLWSSA